jgi:hypothetical protein
VEEEEEEEEIFFPEAVAEGDEGEGQWEECNDNVTRLMEMTDINDYCDDDDASVESGEVGGQIDISADNIVGDILPENGHGIESIKEAVTFVQGWDWAMSQQERVRYHYFFTLFCFLFLLFFQFFFCDYSYSYNINLSIYVLFVFMIQITAAADFLRFMLATLLRLRSLSDTHIADARRDKAEAGAQV